MIKNYFKTTFRTLLRNKGYSAINIMGLSLGLACAMLIILYTKDELSFDRFHTNAPQIYRVVNTVINADGSVVSKNGLSGTFQGPKFTAGIPEFQSFVRVNGGWKELKQGTEIIGKQICFADSNFFSMFTFPLLAGNPITALKAPNAVVVSEDLANEQFGTINAVGKTLFFKEAGKFEPYTITAIAKNTAQNSSIRFDILMPLKIDPSKENWSNFYQNTFVALMPNADIKTAEAKMKEIYETDARETIKEWAEKSGEKNTLVYTLQPLTDMHLSQDYKATYWLYNASSPMYSYILSGIALFILLIACINFVNLTVAQSVKRAKEIGVRKVVGGDRKQLIMQFLSESFILCFAAFLLAVLIVQLMLPAFNQLTNKALNFSYLLDINLITGYVALFVITGFLAGVYPAIVLSGYNPVQTLYNRFNLAGKSYLQKTLVVFQFSLATLLVIAMIIIYSQFNYLTHSKLGYDDTNVIVIDKGSLTLNETRLLKDELLKTPDITQVAFNNGGRSSTVAKVNNGIEIGFTIETIDESYLPLYKIPVVKGRNFSSAFPSDSSNSVLVNETFVKQAGWKDPIGQLVDFTYNPGERYTVVGVVKDHHFRSLAEEIGPQLLATGSTSRRGYNSTLIKIKPNTEASNLQFIETVFKKMFPVDSYAYKFKDLENLKNYEAEAKWKQMILFGAVITIFISCIGLFALSVLSAQKRTKEIGIKKVLGATVGGVVIILSTDFLKLVAVAMLIAMPIAWLLANKWLQNYPYRIDLSWWIFAAAGILVLFIAIITVSFYSLKAAIANPIKSLRSE